MLLTLSNFPPPEYAVLQLIPLPWMDDSIRPEKMRLVPRLLCMLNPFSHLFSCPLQFRWSPAELTPLEKVLKKNPKIEELIEYVKCEP